MDIKKAIEGLEYLAVCLQEMIDMGDDQKQNEELRQACFMGIKALRNSRQEALWICAGNGHEECSNCHDTSDYASRYCKECGCKMSRKMPIKIWNQRR